MVAQSSNFGWKVGGQALSAHALQDEMFAGQVDAAQTYLTKGLYRIKQADAWLSQQTLCWLRGTGLTETWMVQVGCFVGRALLAERLRCCAARASSSRKLLCGPGMLAAAGSLLDHH
eukprot:scaffold271479_cov19-Tisochrysis_lutea.AAC.1